jgi:DNA-directed RNA polymerase specialized sigma24 family protein
MKHSRPSNVSSEMEPQPTVIPDGDASPVQPRDGVGYHAFVVSAYGAHHAEVFGFVVRASRDQSVAEELLLETYLRLAKEAREGHPPGDVRSWLYRTAAGLVTGRGGRTSSSLREAGRTHATDIEVVLDGLSPDARVALLLAGAGFSGEEIAATMGRSAAATRTLLGRARARVRIRRDLFAAEVL